MRRIAALGLLLLASLPASASAVEPEYFGVPTGYSAASWAVATDEQGNIWFGGSSPNHTNPTTMSAQPTPSLVRLVPSQAHPGTTDGVTVYPTPDDPNVNCCGNQLRSLAYNVNDHKLYWVRSDGHVGWGDPNAFTPGTSGGMFTFRLPYNQDLFDVAAVPNGPGAWFTEHSASNLASTGFAGDRIAFTTGGSAMEGPAVSVQGGASAIDSSRYDSGPAGITVDKDGKPWFVEEDPGNPGYRIGTYTGTGSTYQEFQITPCEGTSPCSGSYTGTGLTDVAIAGDGGIWFTNVINRKFGRFDPSSHQMVQYTMASIGLPAGEPRQMASAPDGSVWMTSYQVNGGTSSALVQIVPAADATQQPAVKVYKIPGTSPLSVGADNAGNVWFATTSGGLSQAVGRLAGVVGVPPGGGGGGGGGGGDTDNGGGGGGGTNNNGGGGGTGGGSSGSGGTSSGPAPITLQPATVGTAQLEPPQTGNGEINANQICVGPPQARCSLIYLVKEHEYVTGFPSSVSAKKKAKKKPKPRTLATKAVTLKGGEKRKITIKLNKLGQRILKAKGKVKVDFVVTEKLADGKTRVVSSRTLTVTAKKAKKKAKRPR